MKCSDDRSVNVDQAEKLIRESARLGSNIVLIQELFEGPYFCKDQDPAWFDMAAPIDDHPTLKQMSALARELGVVLPVSIFERANTTYFNSIVTFDSDGKRIGHYRKSHIPDGPGYQEKFYFSPGDTGFHPVDTAFGRLGIAICWDQWFPETARILALKGAEILFYPTAIGSEPQDPSLDSRDHWTRTMQGHAAANMVPLVASNRIGCEQGESCAVTFYGRSFIADHSGALLGQASEGDSEILTARFDLDAIAEARRAWGVFRDRRPDLYGPLLSLDGQQRRP